MHFRSSRVSSELHIFYTYINSFLYFSSQFFNYVNNPKKENHEKVSDVYDFICTHPGLLR
jgi:hypothetical protein